MADTSAYFVSPIPLLGTPDVSDNYAYFAPSLFSPDITRPTIANVSPAALTNLAPGQLVSFDVLDESGLFAAIFVFAYYDQSKDYEVVWDGSAFSADFADFSARSALTLGYHFSIARKGGWPEAPHIRIAPIDRGGNTSL